MSSKYPKSVISFCVAGNGWIVGSGVGGGDCRDYDILIPHNKWRDIAPSIPRSAVPNTFGGWKFTDSEGVEIDIWPDSLEDSISRTRIQCYIQPHTGILLTRSGSM